MTDTAPDLPGVADLSLPGNVAQWLYDRWQPAPPAHETPARLAHRRLAAAVRHLVAETIATGADAATLDAVTKLITAGGAIAGPAAVDPATDPPTDPAEFVLPPPRTIPFLRRGR